MQCIQIRRAEISCAIQAADIGHPRPIIHDTRTCVVYHNPPSRHGVAGV